MSDPRAALMGFVVVVAVSFGAGFLLADHLNHREQVASTPLDEIRTAPNDVTPRVSPGAKPKLPKPSNPRGGTTVATTEIHVEQPPVIAPEQHVGNVVCPAQTVTCPPLDLRVDLNQTDDGGQYVNIRGADGVSITGRYIPPATVQAPPNRRLAIVGNTSGDVVGTYMSGGQRWSWAASAGYIDQAPWGAVGVVFSWR